LRQASPRSSRPSHDTSRCRSHRSNRPPVRRRVLSEGPEHYVWCPRQPRFCSSCSCWSG
jgi:hypothetical protein